MARYVAEGWDHVPRILAREEVATLLDTLPKLGLTPGTRAGLKNSLVRAYANTRTVKGLSEAVLETRARPVRAILFDKSPDANWTLAWHQDTKIAVRHRHWEREDVPGYEAWSEKEGVPHCRPPVEVLQRMVAVRLHLDPSEATNGPLRISPGTHRLGLIPESDIETTVAAHGERTLLAAPGDALLMSPLTLHASSRSTSERHRRVLHIEYAAETALDPRLTWAYR